MDEKDTRYDSDDMDDNKTLRPTFEEEKFLDLIIVKQRRSFLITCVMETITLSFQKVMHGNKL